MKLLKQVLINRLNFFIAAAIMVSNLFAWTSILLAAPAPYIVEPIRDPEVVALLEYIRSKLTVH